MEHNVRGADTRRELLMDTPHAAVPETTLTPSFREDRSRRACLGRGARRRNQGRGRGAVARALLDAADHRP
jgi:hypothetical protein